MVFYCSTDYVFRGWSGANLLPSHAKFRDGAGGEQDFGIVLDGEAEHAAHM
jgi:hypothetical protein